MKVTFENNIKKINGRTLACVLQELQPGDEHYETLQKLFNKVRGLEDLKIELKEMSKVESTLFLILILRWLGGYSIKQGYEILEEILKEQ